MSAPRAQQLLVQMLNDPLARFRDGQLEGIFDCVERKRRLLIVQKTGWGKSIVYFIATKLLRERGAGPTLLISPLLSLMRNQVEMARRIGIQALNLDSTNMNQWNDIVKQLSQDRCDVLLVSPERLRTEEFSNVVLRAMPKGIGMYVVDEAHCISDWGHDFRPDYRRIQRFVKNTPKTIPIMATTATANDRVVQDVVNQLGADLHVFRGPLVRESLYLQCIELESYAARMAWLAQHVNAFPGAGIIYCLTKRDCEIISDWLNWNGIKVLPYHSQLSRDNDENNSLRRQRENMLLRNQVKALVATVALGMGYDKPDLGFVVHFQRPGSLVAYYQQIGRAGRAIERAVVVLLHGSGDDDINSYFIDSAFPSEEIQCDITVALAQSEQGLSVADLQSLINHTYGRIEHCVRYLEVESIIRKIGSRYSLVPGRSWTPDLERQARINALRYHELERMHAFCRHRGCLMEYLARELDDALAKPCGRCAGCSGDFISRKADAALVTKALQYLKRTDHVIQRRMLWPTKTATQWNETRIREELSIESGRALCLYLDDGWGKKVYQGKYENGKFDNDLVAAARELIVDRWRPTPAPDWVTAVPSHRRTDLVPDFARRLAKKLDLPYRDAVQKMRISQEQKVMQNSVQQVRNLVGAFAIRPAQMLGGTVLLVDDVVDSRWTLTYIGALLKEAGAAHVFPFALAMANSSWD